MACHAYPALAAGMRPGHVIPHPDAAELQHLSGEEEELTHQDIARERGDDEEGDQDYVEQTRTPVRPNCSFSWADDRLIQSVIGPGSTEQFRGPGPQCRSGAVHIT